MGQNVLEQWSAKQRDILSYFYCITLNSLLIMSQYFRFYYCFAFLEITKRKVGIDTRIEKFLQEEMSKKLQNIYFTRVHIFARIRFKPFNSIN